MGHLVIQPPRHEHLAPGPHLEVLCLVAHCDKLRTQLGVVNKGVGLLKQLYIWIVQRHLQHLVSPRRYWAGRPRSWTRIVSLPDGGRLVVVVVKHIVEDAGQGIELWLVAVLCHHRQLVLSCVFNLWRQGGYHIRYYVNQQCGYFIFIIILCLPFHGLTHQAPL